MVDQRKTSEVVFRDDLYPRIETNAITVQKYAEDLSVLPPIELNQHNELIDGWHRWTAHKKVGEETVPVYVTETKSDIHLLELSIERNAIHGLQLSREDKRDMARKIYGLTPQKDRDKKKADLARILSVSDRVVRGWLSRTDKDAKDARNRQIFNLWLATRTQKEIAERCECPRTTVETVLKDFDDIGKHADSVKAAATHVVDFDVPLYNVWKQHTKTPGSSHYGNTEATFLDRLLYLYTKPFDIVVDPFAGGGSTIDICKKRFRRYWVSDRLPIIEREHEIRRFDITDGLPPLPRWKDVRLVYLDPPYWKQSEGRYGDSPKDLSNMDLDQFHETLSGFVSEIAKKLNSEAHIALIIQPTQWKAPGKAYTDHVAELVREVSLPIDMRIQCPYESQQCNAQMVNWSKENRKLLVLSREMIIWRTS